MDVLQHTYKVVNPCSVSGGDGLVEHLVVWYTVWFRYLYEGSVLTTHGPSLPSMLVVPRN